MRSRRKAISGAITALILVIASVVIAIAVVGLAFGLFSGFAGSGTGLQQVGTGTLSNVTYKSTSGVAVSPGGAVSGTNYAIIQVTIKNGGSNAVAFPSTISFAGTSYTLAPAGTSSLGSSDYAVYISNPSTSLSSGSTPPNQVTTVQPNSAQTYYLVFPVTNFNPGAYSSPSTLDLNFPNGVTLPITYVYPNQ